MGEPQRLHAQVEGRVQGVSFRYFVLQRAIELGLTGWVRNRPDGSVEVMAEGPRAALDQLLTLLHAGPPMARVLDVTLNWLPASGQFARFEIAG